MADSVFSILVYRSKMFLLPISVIPWKHRKICFALHSYVRTKPPARRTPPGLFLKEMEYITIKPGDWRNEGVILTILIAAVKMLKE